MDTHGAALDEVQGLIGGALFDQRLALLHGKGLHVARQNIPLLRAELAAQGIARMAVGDGLNQALDIKAKGGG